MFDALKLDPATYAADSELRGPARRETDETLRDVIAYRIYRDQQRGWRLTSPNLEQTGLLRIDYDGLDDCCADEEMWSREAAGVVRRWREPGWSSGASWRPPQDRKRIAKVLLDYMRRELAIKVDALTQPARRRSSSAPANA